MIYTIALTNYIDCIKLRVVRRIKSNKRKLYMRIIILTSIVLTLSGCTVEVKECTEYTKIENVETIRYGLGGRRLKYLIKYEDGSYRETPFSSSLVSKCIKYK